MKKLTFALLATLLLAKLTGQTTAIATFNPSKLGYGLSVKHKFVCASIENGTYNVGLEKVSLLKYGIGFSFDIKNGNCLEVIPVYNKIYNHQQKIEGVGIIPLERLQKLSVELGGRAYVNNLSMGLWIDCINVEAKVGFGYRF